MGNLLLIHKYFGQSGLSYCHATYHVIVSIGMEENVRWRALTEEHARDSFENLLFSVCRFRELTGMYPYNITVSHLFSINTKDSTP